MLEQIVAHLTFGANASLTKDDSYMDGVRSGLAQSQTRCQCHGGELNIQRCVFYQLAYPMEPIEV